MDDSGTTTIVVGIAGGSGSGKTTVAERIAKLVGEDRALIVHHDAYYHDLHRMPAGDPAKINYDHPDSLETSLCVEQIRALKQGRSVQQPVYDFSTHRRSPRTQPVEPKPVILVDGILVLASPELRAECDLRVYVDTPADIRLLRRIERDVSARGRTVASVREQFLATVRPMHEAFVEPSRRFADIVMPGDGGNDRAVNLLAGYLLHRLEYPPTR